MNREIKFRVWSKERSKWVFPIRDVSNNFNNSEHLIFEQYTGVKDKNCKEIFEGDIVNSGMTGATYIIRFGEFQTKTSTGVGFWKEGIDVSDRGMHQDSDSQYVIGNIHENKTPKESANAEQAL